MEEAARWRTANAIYEEAERAENREDNRTALALYMGVIARLDGMSSAGPRSLRLYATNAAAVILHLEGDDTCLGRAARR